MNPITNLTLSNVTQNPINDNIPQDVFKFTEPIYAPTNVYPVGLFDLKNITFDQAGNFYISNGNGDDDKIYKYDKNFNLIKSWGGFGGGNGKFINPSGLLVVGSYIYVCDSSNSRIQKFDLTGNFISKFSYSMLPLGIAMDAQGNLLVVDATGNRVIVFTSTGTFITSFGSAGSTDGKFNSPSAIAIDSIGNIFVADTTNHRIQKFNYLYNFISKVVISTDNIIDVKIDTINNDVYVSDGTINKIFRYDNNLNLITTIDNTGIVGLRGFCLKNETDLYLIDYLGTAIRRYQDKTGAYELFESYDNSIFNLVDTILKANAITSTGSVYIIYDGSTHNVDGRTMYYKIRVLATDGSLSAFSSVINVHTPVSVINGLVVYNNAEKTVLNWNSINTSTGRNTNFISYLIYKEDMIGTPYSMSLIDTNNAQINFLNTYTNKFIKIYHPSSKSSWQGIIVGNTFVINDGNKIFGEAFINYSNILTNDLNVYVETTPTFLTSTGATTYNDLSFGTNNVYLYKIYGWDSYQTNIPDENAVITYNFLTVVPSMRTLLSSSTGLLSSTGYLNNPYWQQMKATLNGDQFWDLSRNSLPFLNNGLTLKFYIGVGFIIADTWINNIYYGATFTDQYGQFNINSKLSLYNNKITVRMRSSTGSIIPTTLMGVNINSYYSYNHFIIVSQYVINSYSKLESIKNNNFLSTADTDHLWSNFAAWFGETSRGGLLDDEQRSLVSGIYGSFSFSGYMQGIIGLLDSWVNSNIIDHYYVYENLSPIKTLQIPLLISSTGLISNQDYSYGVSSCLNSGEETPVTTLRLDRRWWPSGFYTNNIFQWDKDLNVDKYKIYKATSTGNLYFMTSTGQNIFIDHGTIVPNPSITPILLNYSGLNQPQNLIDVNFNNMVRDLSFRTKELFGIIIVLFSNYGRPFAQWDKDAITRILHDSMLGAELKKYILFIDG